MRAEQYINQNQDQESEPPEGYEKQTFKMNLLDQIVAAKIYKEKNGDGKVINRSKKAEAEFQAYIKLMETPLKKFIPLPVCLLQDPKTKDVIGLAVEWRNATLLVDLYPQKVLSKEDVAELGELFANFTDTADIPCTDMLSEENLMIEKTENGIKIWFAECGFADNEKDKKLYPTHLKVAVEELIRDYMHD
ncbi:hypothetical protein KKI22_04240 [Patescibacteria group bacterium]|nr:hypothetical protein [Patescibacteria group bacterium]